MELQGRDLSLQSPQIRGDDVELLIQELVQLGFTDSTQQEIDEKRFGAGTQRAVREFQERYGLEPTGVVDAATAARINAQVDKVTFTVDGKVVSRLRAGVGGLRVEIVDKNVGDDDVPLAAALTDERGGYQTTFTIPDLGQRGKDKPDLQARAFRGETFLGVSDVRYNASNRETLNVLLTDGASSGLASEHETLTTALSARFRGPLRDLKETDGRQDITYLANKTGWDARAVAMAALADQFSAATTADGSGATAIETPFFYALFRAGLPANENAIYQADAKSAEAVWKQAVNQGVISTALRDRVPQAIERFQRLAAEHALDRPALVGESSLKEMLTESLGADSGLHRKFAELQAKYGSDLAQFWQAIRAEFGEPTEKRLRLDGQLAYLTLNNAPLIRKLHEGAGQSGLRETLQLAQSGYYQADKWQGLIGDVAIPPEIPGEGDEKKRRYAELMAAEVRLSFPTAVLATMVKNRETPVKEGLADQVHAFLTEHQGKFEIGMQPVGRYIARNNLQIAPEVTREIKRIERVRQITPSDDAMNTLLKKGVDSAYAVVRYGQDAFIRAFKNEVGGEANARLIFAKARQVDNTVVNIVTSYLIARTAPALGVHSPAQYVDPAPQATHASDVIAYPTLEALFGEMDYCACEHCRSILSPAAYLVNLLQFIDPDAWAEDLETWNDSHGAPYPFVTTTAWNEAGNPTNTEITPLQVLLSRRPDIQHLPLTCENTNTPLPYIDLVNETLEYYIANGLSLADTNPDPNINTEYTGHNTDSSAKSEELLASPQFVSDTAYIELAGENFPPPLPFHQPLENLRRYFDRFKVPLSNVMETLRKNDDIERANANDYAWRDILLEELRFSRAEYALLTSRVLTNGNTDVSLTVKQLYGFDPATLDSEVLFGKWTNGTDEKPFGLSYVKPFTRRVGISYEDIIDILKTRFINPNSAVIPKLQRLRVPFSTLKALKDGAMTDAQFESELPSGLDASQYGGDIVAWVKNEANYAKIMELIVVANPTDEQDLCSFDKFEFRYSNPDNNANKLTAFEFIRLIRFIRLWKKLGWTIEQTDKAVTALYPVDQAPTDPNDAVNLQKLDAGFLTLLPRLGVVVQVTRALNLTPRRDLVSLLACWSEIDTHGNTSLYRQMFFNPTILAPNTIFADNGYGEFLQHVDVPYVHSQATLEQPILDAAQGKISYNDSAKRLSYAGVLEAATRDALKAVPGVSPDFQQAVDALFAEQRLDTHAEALRSAFNLTGSEYGQIVAALGYDTLTLPNISAIYRHGWLARKSKISVRELLLLIQLTDLDPFAAPDPPHPPMLRLIELVNRIRSALKPVEALYLIWNQDISGRSAPDDKEILGFTRTLRSDLAAIENEFAVTADPDGSIARARMALVYGNEATDLFFGLLDNTFVTEVQYDHHLASLEQHILDAAPGRIGYDDFRKQLSFIGVMTEATREALKVGATLALEAALDKLYDENRKIVGPFFDRYPELRPLYDAYAASTESIEKKRSNLLANFLPELKRRRKRQQALQAIGAAANSDVGFAGVLLDSKLDSKYVLHASGDITRPALDDLIALEKPGLSAQFFFADTAGGNPGIVRDAEADLAYSPGGNTLPPNANNPANAISGIWYGYLEVPENSFYNLRIEVDQGATVGFTLNDSNIALAQDGGVWSNIPPIELRAGTLYPVVLKVEKVKDTLRVRWQGRLALNPSVPAMGRGWEVIPPHYLYSATLTDRLRTAYIRFLKATALADGLKLTAGEMLHFAAHADYQIGGQGWLNSLPVTGSPDSATSAALLTAFTGILDFASMKTELSPNDERLLAVLKDPASATQNPDSALFALTGWESDSLSALRTRFAKTIGDLAHVETFRQIHDAYALVTQLRVPAAALLEAATNEPDATAVREFQSALRARYNESDWLNVLKPINDEMRGLQRDALVAYILHQMRASQTSAHIDTTDKLFEYFLMDVQMDACMQTSRVRHALSSVQLFIDRCLMNLEPRVAPSVIKAKQWEWMKRYRVWEASRKVFLWPENWCEPELRDDQSPFFKETMSELLQSDITEDRAATALLNYLSKLEEVAKLEPCGIHYLEPESETADDLAHVVARTSGANRKYYYRRREGGSWTPWEQIKLDIEDNPVVPVVWKDRLFVFWLRILGQAPLEEPQVPDQNLASFNPKSLGTALPRVTVRGVLCWSEYYNGKWQTTKTSDINQPVELGKFDPEIALHRTRWLSVSEEGGALRVNILDPDNSVKHSAFLLYNTYSLPMGETGLISSYTEPGVRYLRTAAETFQLHYWLVDNGVILAHSELIRQVLKNEIHDWVIEPQQFFQNVWDAPFFYEDSRHVFYVTTTDQIVRLPDFDGFYVLKPSHLQVHIEPLVLEPGESIPDKVGPVVQLRGFGIENRAVIERFVSEDAYIDKAIVTGGTIPYGNVEIGISGGLDEVQNQ